ncbi:uncharacterized protein LY89DRAFT_683569 [Mollisia scopiformis]|uniref:Methyltransferase domain-containing protein n=1 Tax=Mollisia scopiformis TaxID=149040 RepID=A0A194XEU5_MOLSC|nr:uncharacterized protein LY89DRAFT_683569 [Mollisia scopiformis]KUJ18659.1 hypothetical protein LY89DRAFT_683569 [Mollisia scopiformis]
MTTESSKVDWSLADGQGYILDRDRSRSHIAACRLNLQHYLWKEALKFNIHPSILLPKNNTIADVATGTAMWPIDVARQFPDAQIHGFDNDIRQAPHRDWLPLNLSIRYWNIFEELPNDLVGKYDYVHVRLLVLVIQEGNPRSVLRKLWKMLKPGGFLQWDELDCVNMHVKKVDPSLQSPALDEIREMSWANGRHDWTIELPRFMTEEGFQDAKIEYFGDGPELSRAFNEQHLLTMEEFASSLIKIGKVEAGLKFHRLIEDGYQESTIGAALCIPRVVCVAKKPL